MRWDAVAEAMMAEAAADQSLAAIYGSEIRYGSGAEHETPRLEFTVIASTQSELWEPHVVQVDQWTRSLAHLAASERRLRALFDHDEPVFIEGVYMFAVWADGAELGGPTREGYYGRAARFRLTPIREKLLAGRS